VLDGAGRHRDVRFAFASMHLPERNGAAAGRALRALADGLVEIGHEVSVATWTPQRPVESMPAWFEQIEVGALPAALQKARAVVHPRDVAARARWQPPADAVLVAHEYTSFPALRAQGRAGVLLEHHLLRVDLRASGRGQWRDVQPLRAQRRALRHADRIVATSERVARLIGPAASACPLAYPADDALDPIEEPVAGVVANWRWPPNAAALEHLLREWPAVRDRVPGARLVLAGRGSDEVGVLDGVRALGPVADSAAVLAECAVVPFPCPDSTGPKVKVFEALSRARAVITTTAGAEGLDGPEDLLGSMIADGASFADRLVAALTDPALRARIAAGGRRAVIEGHAPAVVAAAWVSQLTRDEGRRRPD
jgi:glycosyltransferase involved in cell wall biosynthesis